MVVVGGGMLCCCAVVLLCCSRANILLGAFSSAAAGHMLKPSRRWRPPFHRRRHWRLPKCIPALPCQRRLVCRMVSEHEAWCKLWPPAAKKEERVDGVDG